MQDSQCLSSCIIIVCCKIILLKLLLIICLCACNGMVYEHCHFCVSWAVKLHPIRSFWVIKCPAFSCSYSLTHDVTLCNDTVARSSSSCVPAFVEPCGPNKGSRVGASVDHTSVPTQGQWGWGGGRREEGGREGVGLAGKPLASTFRWVSALACDTDKSCCHSHFQPAVTLSCCSQAFHTWRR